MAVPRSLRTLRLHPTVRLVGARVLARALAAGLGRGPVLTALTRLIVRATRRLVLRLVLPGRSRLAAAVLLRLCRLPRTRLVGRLLGIGCGLIASTLRVLTNTTRKT